MQLTDNLVLGLTLEEILGDNTLVETSMNSFKTEVFGAPTVVPDDYFGSCINFNGSIEQYIKIADLRNFPTDELTVACWVKSTNLNNKGTILSFANQVSNDACVLLDTSNFTPGINAANGASGITLSDGLWHHVCITWQKTSGIVNCIIDGELAHTTASLSENAINSSGSLVLGQRQDSADKGFDPKQAFEGEMAHVYIYQTTLTLTQIRQLMQANKTAQVAFKHEYPIDFELIDDDEYNVLYISDLTSSNVVSLQLKNTAFYNVLVMPQDDKQPTKDNYHLGLTFKPKTFRKKLNNTEPHVQFIRVKGLADDWAVSDTQEQTNGMVSLYFIYKGTHPFILESEKTLDFELEYSSADSTSGTRGSNVTLSYQNLSYDSKQGMFSGERLKSIGIVNQRGKKDIPLFASIVGSNTVLNDANAAINEQGRASTIIIRLINTMTPLSSNSASTQLAFNTKQTNTTKNSRFTVIFDDAVGDEWDLASPEDLQQIHALVRYSAASVDIPLDVTVLSDRPIFSFTAPSDVLKAGEYFDITLSNIRSDCASGLSNIYVSYEDIPGYWDGRFIVQAVKTPIVHRNIADDTGGAHRNIGMGILPDAQHRLKIGGDLAITGKVKERYQDGNYYNLVPPGTVVMWHASSNTSTMPKGWALCDGTSYLRPDGSKVVTPDLTGRFIVGAAVNGKDQDVNKVRYAIGETGGSNQVTLTTREMPRHAHSVRDPQHNHSINDRGHSHSVNDPGHSHNSALPMRYSSTDIDDDSLPIYARNNASYYSTSSSKTGIRINSSSASVSVKSTPTGISINSEGSSVPHENRPPFYALYYIMKL